MELDVEIREIGARGDGIALLDGGQRLYVPYTTVGDVVRVQADSPHTSADRARIVQILQPGPGRQQPPCRHFGSCGGCALQHLDGRHYGAWKAGLLVQALAQRGIESKEIRAMLAVPAGSRRRAELTAVRRKGDLLLGFNARASHQVVDLAECPVMVLEIVALMPALRELLFDLLAPAETAEIVATKTDSGLDLLLTSKAALGLSLLERLAGFAEAHDLARLARRDPQSGSSEVLLLRRPVRVRFEDTLVELPPGGFLQATAEGEAALRQAVRKAIGSALHVADLYAGCGTFALPLAAEGRDVHAIEGDGRLVEAIDRAARAAAGRLRVRAFARDLTRRPLPVEELDRFDAVVLDPPRVGAKAQAEALAASAVPRIAALSCNPATFARDARILMDGGYRLEWVQPIDQFLWSPHLELAAAFRRA